MKSNKWFVIPVLLFFFVFPLVVNATPIEGSYVGTFISPVPPSPPSVTTGIGTDNIAWGIPCDGVTNCYTSPGGITPPSSFLFRPVLFSTEIGDPFVLGEIDFFNGTIMPGTEITTVNLFLDGFQITPTQFAGPDSRVISIVNTVNSGDPIASADRATIPMAFFPAANAFGVLESEMSTATVLGMFSEISPQQLELNILGFGEAKTPSGFLEGYAANAIPEPSTFLLLGAGILALAWNSRRFKS